jgi:hypothetical protein
MSRILRRHLERSGGGFKGYCCAPCESSRTHGNFLPEVKRLQQQGHLGMRAPTTMRKARRTAECFLLLSGTPKPTLRSLRADPSPLYS